MTERKTTLDIFELRVLIKSLSRSCDALLKKMDRVGKQPELIDEYEQMDALLLKARKELLVRLKGEASDG